MGRYISGSISNGESHFYFLQSKKISFKPHGGVISVAAERIYLRSSVGAIYSVTINLFNHKIQTNIDHHIQYQTFAKTLYTLV